MDESDNASWQGLHAKQKPERASTPRNLVFPEVVVANDAPALPPDDDDYDASINMEPGKPSTQRTSSYRRHPRNGKGEDGASHTSATANKYAVADKHNEEAMTTGLPSAILEKGKGHQRVSFPRGTRRKSTILGNLQQLRTASVVFTKQALRSGRQLYRHFSLQQLIAYWLVLAGLVAESTTPAPRYNVPVGILLVMTPPRGHLDHRLIVTILVCTALVDFWWLLRPQEGSFNASFHTPITDFARLSLACCTMSKLWLIYATYFELGPESEEKLDLPTSELNTPPVRVESLPRHTCRSRVWQRAKYMFPRKTLPRRSQLSYEVLMRVVTLIWLHGICGLALLLLSLIALVGYAGRAQFRVATMGVPLPIAMVFKAATTLLSYVVATQHVNYNGCLTLSGCPSLAHALCVDAAADHGGIILKYNKRWSRRLQRVKLLDAIVGIYVLLVYYSAFHATTFVAGHGVSVLLALMGVIIVVLELWTPLLIMVAARCGMALHTHHRRGTDGVDAYYPHQLEWDDEDESDDDEDDDEDDEDDSSSGDETRAPVRARYYPPHHDKRGASNGDANTSAGRSPMLPPLQRANSMLIVDAVDAPQENESQRAYWVRYWDDDSQRSYLVHSLTREAIWEIAPSAGSVGSARAVATAGMQSARSERKLNSTAAMSSARSQRRQPSEHKDTMNEQQHESEAGAGHEYDEHQHEYEYAHTSALLPASSPSPAPSLSPPSIDVVLNAEQFMLLWDALPDGGGFRCHVSRIPSPSDLTHHLMTNAFVVATDTINVAGLRVVQFYGVLDGATSTDAPYTGNEEESGWPTGVAYEDYFLGEFTFDSLSLKLFAQFRCADVDAIVPFVKRLQLKEIVGTYAPCDG